jgi:hypothetical protein
MRATLVVMTTTTTEFIIKKQTKRKWKYSLTSLIRTTFFEKFCSDNRNSGLLKLFYIRVGLKLFLNMFGLSRILD